MMRYEGGNAIDRLDRFLWSDKTGVAISSDLKTGVKLNRFTFDY